MTARAEVSQWPGASSKELLADMLLRPRSMSLVRGLPNRLTSPGPEWSSEMVWLRPTSSTAAAVSGSLDRSEVLGPPCT